MYVGVSLFGIVFGKFDCVCYVVDFCDVVFIGVIKGCDSCSGDFECCCLVD